MCSKIMAQSFLENPSIDLLSACRKDDLLSLAEHFRILVVRSRRKQEVKLVEFDKPVSEGIVKRVEVPDSVASPTAGSSEMEVGPAAGASVMEPGEAAVAGSKVLPAVAGLSLFQPFSPASECASALESARLKVRLAQIEAEAREKEQMWDSDFRLAVKRLEIDKEVRLRQSELGKGLSLKETSQSSDTENGKASVTPLPPKTKLEITKIIPILPQSREAEVDAYFTAFECIVMPLSWPERHVGANATM